MTSEQREKKNRRLREWRKRKRQTDPDWAKRQSEYNCAYAKQKRLEGGKFWEKRRATLKAYYQRLTATESGKEKLRQSSRKTYHQTMADPERAKAYRKRNNEHRRQRKKSAPAFALRCALRSRLSDLVRRGTAVKGETAIKLVGCTIEELRVHLERQFKRGMSWNNYGVAWHIDHIVPCAAFDLTDERQQRICFNYLNLRPIWSKENISKGSRILEPSQLPLGI